MYKVLLADDEPLILTGLRRKIDWNALGFEIVGECTDGRTLVDEVLSKDPDLLILDIQMPHMTGLEALKAIRNVSSAPSIVISGFSDFSYAQEALRYGVIDYLLKPVASSMLQDAVLKAKQRLDTTTVQGRRSASLMFHFLRMNADKMTDEVLLSRLALSGRRHYYWIAAFRGPCSIRKISGEEIVMFRYDEDTMIAVIHMDAIPDDSRAFVASRFSFDGDAGLCRPFRELHHFAQATDDAIAALETSWFRHGIYLWSTENEAQSTNFFLRQLEQKGQNSAEISGLLSSLPAYLLEHRLNVRSVESIYNALLSRSQSRAQEQPVRYSTWKEIKSLYKSADYLLSELHRMLAPDADSDNSASSSRAVVFKVKAILQKDYAQPLSLQSMAGRFHIDNSYLSSLFREETGKTFTNYLTEIRMRHACEYLRTTSLTNSKIAQLCGFTSDSYMKKVFRKVLGITPSAYRTQTQAHGKAAENIPVPPDQKEERT